MKRIIILFITLLPFTLVNAQSGSTIQNKNGFPITPETGDIAIGINLSSPLQYLGNFFNGNTNNAAPGANFTGLGTEFAITGKYFLSNTSAVRATLLLGNTSNTNSHYVADDAAIAADPQSHDQVTDIQTINKQSYGLGVGYEMRRGSTRLQGIYGANLYFNYSNDKIKYKYGNPMSADNPLPTTYNFGANIYNSGRQLKVYNGQQFGLAADLFVGVEYFILPKISIGAEFSYAIGFSRTKQAKFNYEYWSVDKIEKVEATNPGDASRYIMTKNPRADFFMMFHF